MDANSTLISSKWKSHEISWISWIPLPSWFQRNWQLVGDYMHHSTQQHLFLWMVEGFMNSGCFLTSPKILVVDIVDLLEEVLNRGLALQIRVYPKARGAAETIINNQEDDDQQRTCWCLVSSIPSSIDPHVGDHVGLVPILNRYHLATPNPRCCGMNARDICCSWRLSRLERLKNCYECAALIVIVKILNDWCAYELV